MQSTIQNRIVFKMTFRSILLCALVFCSLLNGQVYGQNMRYNSFSSGGGGTDSLQKRYKSEDSIAVFYKLYNSLTIQTLDTSVQDFYTKLNFFFHFYVTDIFFNIIRKKNYLKFYFLHYISCFPLRVSKVTSVKCKDL